MIQYTHLKPRSAGGFIRLYLDGVVYEDIRKKAKQNSKPVQKIAVLIIEEALGLNE